MKIRFVGFLVLIIWVDISAGEVPVNLNLNFKRYESGPCVFSLCKYEMSKPVEAAIVFGVSTILDTYKKTFGFNYPDNFQVKITIFENQEDFFAYQKSQNFRTLIKNGYYSGRRMEAVVWSRNDPKIMLPTLFHEANHMILGYQLPAVPRWINEGLSIYFGYLNVLGKHKRIVLHQGSIKSCRYWLENGFPIELNDYISLDREGWVKLRHVNSNAAHRIGYVLIYYMMSHKKTKDILKKILWDIKKNGNKADCSKIIDNNFPGGVPNLKKSWLNWIPKARPYRPVKTLREHKSKVSSSETSEK